MEEWEVKIDLLENISSKVCFFKKGVFKNKCRLHNVKYCAKENCPIKTEDDKER